MLCENCGRREATVHIVQIGPDGRHEENLCEKCAAAYGVEPSTNSHREAVTDFLRSVFHSSEEQTQAQVCPVCGMTLQDLQKTGKIGCASCYDFFRPQLDSILRRIHGSSPHVGKFPQRSGVKLEAEAAIENLRAKLQEAIRLEEYENAATYRDEIREWEKRLEAQKEEGGADHVAD